jgi:hypothetical protein
MPERARTSDQQSVLSAALERARARPGGVAVLDLDSTLLDNRPRQARILQEYGRAAGLPALLAARPEHVKGWDLACAMRSAGVPEPLVRLHAVAFVAFWEERFFTSELCRLDVPVPGAPAFARALAAAGARIAYVTGRPEAMEGGTLEVLGRYRFPLPDGEAATLFMKPLEALGDDEWKEVACELVERLGPVVLAVDNEPAHVNAYARAWPDAMVIHVDTDHSGRPVQLDRTVPSVADLRLEAAAEPLGSSALSGGAADATAPGR